MKILVLGASQGTGALCVKAALAQGHAVTAFARTPSKLDVTNGAALGQYTRAAEPVSVPSSISRADTAAFLLESCTSPAFVGKAVGLGG